MSYATQGPPTSPQLREASPSRLTGDLSVGKLCLLCSDRVQSSVGVCRSEAAGVTSMLVGSCGA